MDTHTHRASSLAVMIGLNLKAAELQWSCNTIVLLLTTEGVAACEHLCLHDICPTGCASLQNVSVFISVGTVDIGHGVCCVGIGCAPAHMQYV